MIKIETDSKGRPTSDVWIFSDPHFNHKNICRGTTNWRTPEGEIPVSQTRDFPTLEKMNATIVNNINENVMQDDILICLGDWSFGGYDSIREFWDRIVCKNIHLILGNHDHHIERNKENIQSIFSSVSQYLDLEVKWRPYHSKLVADSYTRFVLFHYPIASWNGMSDGVIHLHGHVHLPPRLKIHEGQAMDVGVDGNNLEPYSLNEILKIMKGRPVKHLSLPKDHHTEE